MFVVVFFSYSDELFIQGRVHIHLYLHQISAIYRSAGTGIVCFTLTCVFLPSPAALSRISKKARSLPSHVTACSVLDVKSRLTQMSNRREMDCEKKRGGGVLCYVLMTSALHWKWHIDAFKLMRLPSTFSISVPPFTLRLFNFPWSSAWFPSVPETDAP